MNVNYFQLINYALTGAVVLLAALVIYLFIYFGLKKKNANETILELNQKFDNLENNDELLKKKLKKTKKKKNNQPGEPEDPFLKPSQNLLDFDRICDDMIVKDDGSLYSMAIQCRGIGFDLLSNEEKSEVQENFAKFLSTVSYPLQIHVQTRILDYKKSAEAYSRRLKSFEEELRSMVEKFNHLQINKKENKSQLAELARRILRKQRLFNYAKDFEDYMERISSNNYVYQNNYYIVVSCTAKELGIQPKVKRQLNLAPVYSELSSRCKTIITALGNCGVEAVMLNSEQLAQLLYSTLSQEEEGLYSLREAMESGFFKLYTSQR